jgi:hypothetical protein
MNTGRRNIARPPGRKNFIQRFGERVIEGLKLGAIG